MPRVREKLLETALKLAQEKLKLYRALHTGEYIGGMEFRALMQTIEEALNA